MISQLETLLHGYIDHEDGTILDLNTNLIWQQEGPEEQYTWQQAKEYCISLSLAGHTDWRLPTKEELKSLIDKRYEPTICPVFQCHKNWYWSSTSKTSRPGSALAVYFGSGFVSNGTKGNNGDVRAVRRP